MALPAALVTRFSFAVAKAKQDAADMAAKTHTILMAGGSGLVGHAAIKFAIAAGHFVIALVRRGGSPSVEGLASEETADRMYFRLRGAQYSPCLLRRDGVSKTCQAICCAFHSAT